MDTLSARPRHVSSETPANLSGTKSVIQDCPLRVLVSLLLQHLLLFLQEFEIELEGSQYLRILCYEKCYDKSMLNKDDNEIVDKIMGKGQVQVRRQLVPGGDVRALLGTFPSTGLLLMRCLLSAHNTEVWSLWPLMVLVGLIV